MHPEKPNKLVALRLDIENGNLVCRGERVFAANGRLKISWYTATKSTPESYISIMDGVAFAYKDSVKDVVKVDQFRPTKRGNLYRWCDEAPYYGLMIALVLPAGRPANHSQETRSALLDLALQKPRNLGYPFELWTLERLQNAFKERHGVHLSDSTIWTWVEAEGFRWRKQESWFREPEKNDPEFAEKGGSS